MVRLDHVNMTVNNLNDTLDWYNRVFDFNTVQSGQHNNTPFAIIRSGDSMLCLYEYPERKPDESSCHLKIYHFGFQITDRDDWEKRVKKNNVNVTLKIDYPFSTSWYVEDPSGHEIEVSYWQDNKIQFPSKS